MEMTRSDYRSYVGRRKCRCCSFFTRKCTDVEGPGSPEVSRQHISRSPPPLRAVPRLFLFFIAPPTQRSIILSMVIMEDGRELL